MIKRKQTSKFLILFSIVLLNTSCYKNVKGCLDQFSKNYTAYADEECDNCCEYPEINLQLSFSLGDLSYSSARFTSSNEKDSFFIINAGLYFHNLQFQAANEDVRVSEEIGLTTNDGTTSRSIDDFVKISPFSNSYTIGTHQSQDIIKSASISLGLPAFANQLDSADVPTVTDLSQVDNLLYSKSLGYLTAFMDIYYDTTAMDTIRYSVPIGDLSGNFEMESVYLLDYGEDLNLTIKVDLLEWTKGIDFEMNSSDTALVKSRFVENIPNSISLE